MASRRRKPAAQAGLKEVHEVVSTREDVSQQEKAAMSHVLSRQPLWLVLAVASGGCAALNGVFAKLTTTQLTSSIAASLARSLSLAEDNKFFELLTRAFFFGCNLLFNVAMWALFTAALTRASSTTRVSIINVSTNFVVTALLGLAIFGEKLPGLWWVGAGLLAVGNVVIGRREEGEKPGGTIGLDETRAEAERLIDIHDEDTNHLAGGDSVELRDSGSGTLGGIDREEEERRLKRGEEADNPI